MELEDCAFPLLHQVRVGSDPDAMFEGVSAAFLVGAKPRGPGMERKDLIADNAKIFVQQGKALNRSASKEVRVLVVGNPCNTNCLIAAHHAPRIPKEQFFAMTRLDQNRARSMLARKAGVAVSAVSNMAIWGNHSSTQVPDFEHAMIHKRPVQESIFDSEWLKGEFLPSVQKRGAEVIAARGKSSAASAANAALEAMQSVFHPTHQGDWFSMGVSAEGNPYGVDERLYFSFPCTSKGKGDCSIVSTLKLTPFLQEKIALTQKELLEELEIVAPLLRD